MRTFSFAKRTAKEILRDPLTLLFGLGFPCVLILLLSAIQANVPVSMFEINALAPAMTIFGLSFMTLFSASLIAKDRESAFLVRLYATPMRALHFVLGYTLPLLPMALLQSLSCFIVGFFLGLDVTVNVLWCLFFIIPVALFFIALGLLFGSILTQKQAGGICGGLLTNLSAWLSGIWFDVQLVGGAFETVANLLPFAHAVKLEKAVFAGNFEDVLLSLLVVLGYALATTLVAVLLFLRQMKKR